MNGGAKYLAAVAVLAIVGCDSDRGHLQIRSTPTPLSATAKPVPFRIAEGRSHVALGNVALALESFRKASREQPDNIDALAGMAACYDEMERFDLSRRYFEAALALAPGDTGLLTAFAGSLARQGRSEEAAAVRGEIRARLAAAATPAPRGLVVETAAQATALPAVPDPQSPVLPPVQQRAAPVQQRAAPVQQHAALTPDPAVGRSVTIALPPANPAPTPQPKAISPEPARLAALPSPPQRQAALAVIAAPPQSKPQAAPASVVTQPQVAVAAAPVPQASAHAAPVSAAPQPQAVVASAAVPQIPARNSSVAAKPFRQGQPIARLERLSLGEVLLSTVNRPHWRPQLVERTERSTTIRFVPLRTAEARPRNIRLLNAARYQGLAARTRGYLAQRGWRQMAIGNASTVRQRSLILYPPRRRLAAERLAAQFGFLIAKRATGTELIILLGRDAGRKMPVRTLT